MKILISIAMFLFLGFAQTSFAAVNVSAAPVDGSNDLRLSAAFADTGQKSGIRVRVISTDGKQYQIFQQVPEPMTNEKGESLDLRAIETQTLSNSNTSGTLYLQNPESLSLSEQLVYTSGQGGASDSFVVGYSMPPETANAGGHFMGKIIFTVRAMGGSSEVQSVVNVSVQSPSSWKVSVQGGHNFKEIRVNDSDTAAKMADFVKVSFAGNAGSEVRIYQELDELPQNEVFQGLQPDALLFDTTGETQDLRIHGRTPLKQSRTLIYSGHKNEDSFVIYYVMDPQKLAMQEAGLYKGKVRYIVETDSSNEEFPLDLQCRIQPVFAMDISVPAEGVNFSHVLADTPPQEQEVTVSVHSNLHKPYQVVQTFDAPLTNENGKEFDRKYFTVRVDVPSQQKGRTRLGDFTSVATGDQDVFSSDTKGSPAVFKVIYRLQGYDRMNAGNFLAPVKFTLNQN